MQVSGDCDDNDPTVSPLGIEVRGDGIDQDCDGADLPYLDLNQDGWPDIAFSGYYDSQNDTYSVNTYVYYGGPEGFSSEAYTAFVSSGTAAVSFEDVNGDGIDDLFQVNHYAGHSGEFEQTSYLYWGGSSGLSESNRTGFETEGCFYAPAVKDLDRDGYKDVVFANSRNNYTWDVDSFIHWGSASGFSEKTALPTMGGTSVQAGDLDGDGFIDLVFGSYYNVATGLETKASVFWGSMAGYYTGNRTKLSTYKTYQAAIADLDEDGYGDLLFTSYNDGEDYDTDSFVYMGSVVGYSDSSRALLPTIGSSSLDILDANRDGFTDLLFSGFYCDSGYNADGFLYWGTAGGFSEASRVTLPMNGAYRVKIEEVGE